MNPNLDRRRFLTGSAALAVPGLAGSWAASGCSSETPKRSLVIDHHLHVFPDQTGALGYDDPDTHNRIMQGAVRSLWGRFVASHTDPKYIPEPGRGDRVYTGEIRHLEMAEAWRGLLDPPWASDHDRPHP